MIALRISFILLFFCLVSSTLFPHKIWMYWNNGYDRLGTFQKLCVQKVKDLHKHTDWEFNFLDDLTVKNWLNQQNYQKFQGSISNLNNYPQVKADLIRYYLLKQHGGVWLDVSIVVTQNLNWLQNILQNPKIIHRNIFKYPQVFIHYQHWTNQQQTIKIKMNGHDYYPLFQIQNAFIASVKESKFINDLINQFHILLKDGENYYNEMKNSYNIPYEYSTYFRSFRACSINQYRKYNQYQQSKGLNNQLLHPQDHFYNVITLNRDAGMYHNSIDEHRIPKLMRQEGEKGDYEFSLLKFSRGPKDFLSDLLRDNLQKKADHHRHIDPTTYNMGQKYLRQEYICLYHMLVRENSAVAKYILTQSTKKFFPKAQVTMTASLPLICKITTLQKINYFQQKIAQWTYQVVILLLLGQFIYQFYVFSIRISLPNIKTLKIKVLTKLIFIYVIFLQIDLIYSQYKLWIQTSPTAFFVGSSLICFTFLLFKWFAEIDYKTQKTQNYWLRLILITLIEYFLIYNNTAWKYQGQVYNYQILSQLNLQKIKQAQAHLVKIFVLILQVESFQFLKRIFFVPFCQNWQQKQKQNVQMISSETEEFFE